MGAKRTSAKMLIPLLSLGRQVVARQGSGEMTGMFALSDADVVAGGPALHETSLYPKIFEDALDGRDFP